jgi:hypothetical protein
MMDSNDANGEMKIASQGRCASDAGSSAGAASAKGN